ncbi:MAG TPA: hypothetical protein VFJ58_03515 [Armatimonadota bacterium]|nr:hypothetical protein [Armatimonadota bacterium]
MLDTHGTRALQSVGSGGADGCLFPLVKTEQALTGEPTANY